VSEAVEGRPGPHPDIDDSLNMGGRVAVVTGAGSGIGRATASLLSRRGASVVLVDIVPEGVDDLAEQVRRSGGQATVHVVDVAADGAMADVIDRTVRDYGRVDVLHNNAADIHAASLDGSLEQTTVEIWRRTLDVNLTGVFLGCRAALPVMRQQARGSIVNTASVNALSGQGRPAAYAVSKAGVIGLTKSIAVSHGPHGIRCNAVLPGQIMTPSAHVAAYAPMIEMFTRNTPLLRGGEPDDVASLVAFLASDAASFLTGACLPIDGGVSAALPFWADMADLLSEGASD
jgi:NAD(P)-dependent dehydrogenase (short-subunit alcohol dehydrogenase family)